MTSLEVHHEARVLTYRTPAVTLRGVSKRHGSGDASVLALDGVSLSVEQGEFFFASNQRRESRERRTVQAVLSGAFS